MTNEEFPNDEGKAPARPSGPEAPRSREEFDSAGEDMAANLIAATGAWGMSSETSIGVIVEGLEEVTRNEKSYQKNEVGERTGRADFDESIEAKLSGKLTANTPFSTKLGANITLGNAIAANSLYNSNTGRTVVNEVKRTKSNEDWRSVEVDIEVLPFFG